jgi:hypothetical protein
VVRVSNSHASSVLVSTAMLSKMHIAIKSSSTIDTLSCRYNMMLCSILNYVGDIPKRESRYAVAEDLCLLYAIMPFAVIAGRAELWVDRC